MLNFGIANETILRYTPQNQRFRMVLPFSTSALQGMGQCPTAAVPTSYCVGGNGGKKQVSDWHNQHQETVSLN